MWSNRPGPNNLKDRELDFMDFNKIMKSYLYNLMTGCSQTASSKVFRHATLDNYKKAKIKFEVYYNLMCKMTF